MLAILCMHKYADVRLEDGISQWQWGQKKLCIIQPYEWGGDLELCLLAIGLGEEVVVVTGSDKLTCAQRFSCHLVMHRYQFFINTDTLASKISDTDADTDTLVFIDDFYLKLVHTTCTHITTVYN